MTKEDIKQIIEQEEEKIRKFQELITESERNITKMQYIKPEPANPYERVEEGKKYITLENIDAKIGTDISEEAYNFFDNNAFENGLYFNDEAFAQKTAKEVELYLKLKKFTYDNGWSDEVWNNTDIPKYSIRKTHLNNIVTVCELFFEKTANVIYFSSEKIAQQAIETFRELIEEVL